MRVREKEYNLYRESTILQTTYMNTKDYKKSRELQQKQNEAYKKWKFFKNMRLEMEKENDKKLFGNSSSK